MMNPRRLSTVPAIVLLSVVFAIGIVGLLATGSQGLQITSAAPPTDDVAHAPIVLHMPEPVVETAPAHALDSPPTEPAPE